MLRKAINSVTCYGFFTSWAIIKYVIANDYKKYFQM